MRFYRFGSCIVCRPCHPCNCYDDGNKVSADITAAIAVYTLSKTEANLEQIAIKRTAGITWLEKFSTLVEPIANSNDNRSTREMAYANIMLSNLTPQKLVNSTKGKPEMAVLTGTICGAYEMLVEITNGESYAPTLTNIVLVQLPAFTTEATPNPVVTLIDGQLVVKGATGEIITKLISGKGKSLKIKFSVTGSRYAVYGYGQNGNKLIGNLSAEIIVKT